MVINNLPIIILVWIMYGIYTSIQYNDNLKKSKYFIISGISFGIISNLLWVYTSSKLNQTETLTLSLLWDSGLHITAFIIPIIVIKEKIKKENLIAMIFIFTGISMVLY